MTIIDCTSCGNRVEVEDLDQAHAVECPHCGNAIEMMSRGGKAVFSEDGPMPWNQPAIPGEVRHRCFRRPWWKIKVIAIFKSPFWKTRAVPICVVAVIILILAAMLLPALPRSRCGGGRRSVCKSNLKQIGLAMHIYATDYNGWFPTTGVEGESRQSLSFLYNEYQPNLRLFVCPSSNVDVSIAYDSPEFTLAENEVSYHYVNGLTQGVPPRTPICWEKKKYHGNNGRNVLFADGKVEWLSKEEQFQSLLKKFGLSEEGTISDE